MMRSGSSLLEHILDAHSQIVGIGEDSIFNGVLPHVRDEIVKALPQGQMSLLRVVSENARVIINKMYDRVSDLQLRSSNYSGLEIGQDQRQRRDSEKPIHIVDKMLFNFQNVGLIHLIFPNALILHTVRDPLDVLVSCLRNKFDDRGLEWTLDEDHILAEYMSYLEIMQHWEHVLPGRVMNIQYENLVYNLEDVMREVIDRLSVDWEDKLLRFHRSHRSVLTNSMTQVNTKRRSLTPNKTCSE